jgi:sulfofructose kinase
VGLSCLDHLWRVDRFPPVKSRTRASMYQVQGGGPAATGAVTVSMLGGEAELWAVHGEDPNGSYLARELEKLGVGVQGVLQPNGGVTLVSGILTGPDGERHIFSFHGTGLADDESSLDLKRVASFGVILFDNTHPKMSQAALGAARASGVPTLADFGNCDNWHLAKLADTLVVSEECAEEILGRNDPEEAIGELRQFPEQVVGITLGEHGYLYDAGQGIRSFDSFPVNVVDTNGAGDVFHGAYAYGIASDWDHDRCGLFASATAALACTALGGRAGIPSYSDVVRLLKEEGVGGHWS